MRQPVMRHSLLFVAAAVLVTATFAMTANAEKAPAAQAMIFDYAKATDVPALSGGVFRSEVLRHHRVESAAPDRWRSGDDGHCAALQSQTSRRCCGCIARAPRSSAPCSCRRRKRWRRWASRRCWLNCRSNSLTYIAPTTTPATPMSSGNASDRRRRALDHGQRRGRNSTSTASPWSAIALARGPARC